MKKFTGWLTIIFCSLFLIIFFVALIAILLSPGDISQTPPQEIIGIVVGFSIFTILLIAGLINGLKKIKKDKPIFVEYTDILDLNLTGRISYKDYRNFILESTFKKPKWFTFICCMIIFLLFYFNKSIEPNPFIEFNPFFVMLFLFFILIYPILVVINIKKLYKTNKILHEQLNYRLTNDSIHIAGEFSNSTQKWTSFYQVKETKNFFMFFQGKGIGVLLDKRMFTDNELANFKQFICSLNLKR